jgi:hypothetical protein
MDNKNSVVKKEVVRAKKLPPQQPLESRAPGNSGSEIWDGSNAGWTLVSYTKKKKNKK